MGTWATLYGITLICVLGLAKGMSCGTGRFQRGTGTNVRCCRLCAPGKEACPEEGCVCIRPEYHCEDPQCKTCKHFPCAPGQEVQAHGTITFGFKCVDCAVGTFSASREGYCRPWAKDPATPGDAGATS
uniref:Tumor necrosis factor receptor superfamily member 18 n=1 Tax=Nannospalax galili TaxID=1026970 RepID=A0A8C6QZ06_NANGA